MVSFGPLTAEIGWRVWGTQKKFNGFCVLASLLYRRRTTEINRSLHDVRPSPWLVYLYFWGSCPLTAFNQVQNSPCVQVLRSPILAALLQGTRAVGVSQTATWYKECNYETFVPGHFQQRASPVFGGRSSRWV